MTYIDVHAGSAEYLLPPAAEEEGVVQATSHWAVLRAGRSSPKCLGAGASKDVFEGTSTSA